MPRWACCKHTWYSDLASVFFCIRLTGNVITSNITMIMFTKFLTFFLHGPFTDYHQTCPVRPVPGANMGPRLAEPRRHQLPHVPFPRRSNSNSTWGPPDVAGACAAQVLTPFLILNHRQLPLVLRRILPGASASSRCRAQPPPLSLLASLVPSQTRSNPTSIDPRIILRSHLQQPTTSTSTTS